MIGRADIEGSKSNVAMNAWLPRASYPCGNSSDTSCIKLVKSKGSIGLLSQVRIHTENQDQASFFPFALREVSVLAELALGHLRYHLTDVPPQPNNPPESVLGADRALQGGSALGARSVILTGRFRLTDDERLFTLETCCGDGYGPTKITLSPSDFQGPQRRTGHRKRRGALQRTSVPSPDEPDSRDTKLYKEKINSSPGPPSTSPSSVLRYRTWSRGPSLRVRVGEINTIPFGRQRGQNEHLFAFSESLVRTDFSILRTDWTHVQLLFTWNPSPAQSSSSH
ncbi:hypothetical protein JTE90_008713 [Oedothorax gibbosus]|uniref:Uncharacterized protein n=1 Tax=Oedothorax gibbosus TaxID=931172 RepID=A0AAV6TDQ0_9ARAC|nr:hypothetical protein JTE90_008713 [Oedothorax gibbosus]